MAYFTSVTRVLQDAVSADAQTAATMLPNIVSGFITELSKRYKQDATLLHNKAICRTIESVLAVVATTSHLEPLLLLFAPKITELMMQPTSSYVVETLLACTYHVLDVVAADTGANGDDGADDSTAALAVNQASVNAIARIEEVLTGIVGDVCEACNELASNTCGAHSVTSLCHMLCGVPIRGVPRATARTQWFPRLALRVTEEFVATVRKWGVGMAGWMSCCTTATSAVLLQGLLRCAATSEAIYRTLVVNGVESIPALIPALVTHPVGVHVVQAYLRTRHPGAAAAAAAEQGPEMPWRRVLAHLTPRLDAICQAAVDASNTLGGGGGGIDDEQETDEGHKRRKRRGDYGDGEGAEATEGLHHALYCLQDLALYTRSEAELREFYDVVVKSRLETLLSCQALTFILVKLTRKLASSGSSSSSSGGANGGDEDAESEGVAGTSEKKADHRSKVKADEAAGVTYFQTATELRRDVCNDITSALKVRNPKGAAHVLLVDRVLADTGVELASNIVQCGRTAAATFLHTLDKARQEDLVMVAKNAHGSRVLQLIIETISVDAAPKSGFSLRSLTAAAAAAPSQPVAPRQQQHQGNNKNQPKQQQQRGKTPVGPAPAPVDGSGAAPAPQHQQQTPRSLFHRFFRRFEPALVQLATDRFGGFVVQAFYEFGPVDVKEAIVKALGPHFNDLSADFYGKKVIVKCCVEQFLFRADEWRKLAERNSNVKLMLQQVLAAERT